MIITDEYIVVYVLISGRLVAVVVSLLVEAVPVALWAAECALEAEVAAHVDDKKNEDVLITFG